MPEVSDQEFLQLFHNPEKRNEAFRLLMNNYQKRIYFHIRRIVINHDDTNDIVQETFIKVFRSLNTFKGESKLFTWIYRIATNEALAFLKSKNRRLNTSLDDESVSLPSHSYLDPLLSGDKIYDKLLKAIDTLPDKQKLVFNMRYFDNMKYEDMSEVLGTSEGALKASYFHAINKIERYLNDH
ncbi:MAG: RNA polymerase sigma factor [Bacteroidia bacterium]|nr:RNA polymerase sigma factor [Bacteroidia bacterium]MCZ2276894.1 RNA polymerase sigma factor [Bacteroidia bacterium]